MQLRAEDIRVAQLYERSIERLNIDANASASTSTLLGDKRRKSWRFGSTLKRIFDVVFSISAIIALAPIMLVIAALVKTDSRGPVLFKQRRNGLNDEIITVWKFRSMSVLENGETVTQATRNDPRVTRVGAVLRKYSLDELPQFFNVLLGTMSVVGPRPHAVSHNEEFVHLVPNYAMRHEVKPGITGLAQVSGARGETDTLDKMALRIAYDIEYIRNWSLKLDVQIIIKTVLQAVKCDNVY